MSVIENNWIKNANLNSNDTVSYLNWFDSIKDKREYIQTGHIDFFNRILTIDMYKYLGNPYNKNCLEIGFGGGRLINAAMKVFSHSFGIDILDEVSKNKTKNILSELNDNDNFTLINRDNKSDIESKSIDFIYSFIVFQHFHHINEIYNYVNFSKRVLKDDGCGIFYFGRNDINNKDYVCYNEIPNPRGCSLYLSKNFAINILKSKFDIIEVGEVTKKPWNNKISGQFYIKFRNK